MQATPYFMYYAVTQFGSGQIHKEAEEVLTADGSAALNQNVQKHCKQLHELLKEAHEKSNIEVVETCFQCWRAMYYFGGMAPLICLLFYISTKLQTQRLTI